MISIFLILFLLLFTNPINSSKLLLTVMDQGRSHATSMTTFMHRIQMDNHSTTIQMTVYSQEIDFGMEEMMINMTQFSNPFASEGFFQIIFEKEFTFLHHAFPFVYGALSCDKVLQHKLPRFNEILQNNFSIIASDSLFAICGYGLGILSNQPHIMMHSTDVESAQGSYKGFARNYAIIVPNFLPYSMPDFSPARFWHRLTATIDWFGSASIIGLVAGVGMKYAFRNIAPEIGVNSYYEYNRQSVFSFTDMPDSLYPAAPRTNDFFSYGSYCKPAKPLSSGLINNFVNDSKSRGTILVSFGSIIDWRFAPKSVLEIFIKVLNRLTDYRVTWSMKGEKPKGLGDHVMVSSWIPQNELLHHPKTVLFLSHGGLKSVKEAICSATPSIFMPMFAEQMRNAWLAKNKGIAKILNKLHLTDHYLTSVIDEMLNTSKYQTNADKYLAEYFDLPMSSLDEAAFKFNKLARYNGRMPRYFYPRSIDLTYVESLNLDLIIFLPLLIIYVLLGNE